MNIVGLAAYAHNAAAALYDGTRVVAAEQERFDGVRKSGAFPGAVFQEVILRHIDPREIDLLAYPWSPKRFLPTYCKIFLNDPPHSLALIDPRCSPRLNVFSGIRTLTRLRSDIRRVLGRRPPPVRFVEHHLSHAANAYFSSPFDRALVLVADAFGDVCSLSIFVGEGSHLRKVYENNFLDSLGMLYSCVTRHLGYPTLMGEGRVMALAGLGDESLVANFKEIVKLLPNGEYRFDFSYLNFHRDGERAPFAKKFHQLFGPPRGEQEPITPKHCSLARALQRTVEDTLAHVVRETLERFKLDRLCFAGGLALNCLANGRLLRETPAREIFVPSAPDDAGAVLGAAQAVAHLQLGMPRERGIDCGDLGPGYPPQRVKEALRHLPYQVSEPANVAEEVAGLIASNRIVAWFQGRMEFGPRALGYRSILADPRQPEVRTRLNRHKGREQFRPYGAAVLAEYRGSYFDGRNPSPFMSFADPTVHRTRSSIPGVTHADGTTRVQTLEPGTQNPLRPVIEAFFRRTGVPCVVNTSLNRQSPIAATPEDAVGCFINADLDALAIGPYLVHRRDSR
jgi:carbamoyltransferase